MAELDNHAEVPHTREKGSSWRNYVRWYVYTGLFLCVVLLPLLAPARASRPLLPGMGTEVFKIILAFLPVLSAYGVVRATVEAKKDRYIVTLFCLVFAGLWELIHYRINDCGHYFMDTRWKDNTAWQIFMHKGIMVLDPGYLPHAYRFLPDCIVTVFMRLTGDFVYSRIIYRLTANVMMLIFIFGYARQYLSKLSSSLVIVFVTLLYPITIVNYAGQLVDPASHLSFAACLYFLAVGCEAGILPTIVVGVLAKESVFVLGACRIFYGSQRAKAWGLAALYVGIGLATAMVIRFAVNGGSFSYSGISGVSVGHMFQNLAGYLEWGPLYLFMIILPGLGAALGWRYLDNTFKLTCVYVVVALVVSSMLFSWLAEVRNLVPALTPLGIALMKYVEIKFGLEDPKPDQKENLAADC